MFDPPYKAVSVRQHERVRFGRVESVSAYIRLQRRKRKAPTLPKR